MSGQPGWTYSVLSLKMKIASGRRSRIARIARIDALHAVLDVGDERRVAHQPLVPPAERGARTARSRRSRSPACSSAPTGSARRTRGRTRRSAPATRGSGNRPASRAGRSGRRSMIGTMPSRRISCMTGSSKLQSYSSGPVEDPVDRRAVAQVAQAQLADELEVRLPHLVVAGVAELVDALVALDRRAGALDARRANMNRSMSTGSATRMALVGVGLPVKTLVPLLPRSKAQRSCQGAAQRDASHRLTGRLTFNEHRRQKVNADNAEHCRARRRIARCRARRPSRCPHPQPAPPGVRPAPVEVLGRRRERAGRHDPVAEHQRRQQRRRLPAAPPPVPVVEPGGRRAGRGSRAAHPRQRPQQPEGPAHPGDPPRRSAPSAARSTSSSSRTWTSSRPTTTSELQRRRPQDGQLHAAVRVRQGGLPGRHAHPPHRPPARS